MEIFSWVHCQFHHKSVADHDKVVLIENEAFASACGGWKDGILAIGTMGIDYLQKFKVKDDSFMNNDRMSLVGTDNHEEEMECPLVLKASKHGFNHVGKLDDLTCDEVVNHRDDVIGAVKYLTKIKRSEERSTLADLLWADSGKKLLKKNKLSDDHKLKVPYHDSSSIDHSEPIKNFSTSKKKKKMDKDHSAQLIKKTKQLLRKMLKKKIHPDISIHKKEVASIASQERDVHAAA